MAGSWRTLSPLHGPSAVQWTSIVMLDSYALHSRCTSGSWNMAAKSANSNTPSCREKRRRRERHHGDRASSLECAYLQEPRSRSGERVAGVNDVSMTRERRQQIAHALLERAHLRVDENLRDERVGRQLDQLLACNTTTRVLSPF